MIINKYNSSTNKQTESRGSGSGGSVYSGGGGGSSSSQSQQTVAVDELWKKGNAQGSLVPKSSYNITEGVNSVAIGTDTQTTNEGELAIGTYNVSTPNVTIFSIGDGVDREHRHNFLEMNGTGTTTLNSSLNVTNNITTPRITATTGAFGNVDADDIDTDTLDVQVRAFIKELTSEEITTEFLTVTKSAHFFELIIDKIKASGGAAIFTPADGFKIADMSHVIPVTNGYVLTFFTNDGNRAIRNMWQEGDQAICMSFNEAHIGTSYNVKNKYYWCLVTRVGTLTAGDSITDINGNAISFDEDRHFIQISTQSGTDSNDKPYYEGNVNPETGDEIVMLGYRGTDDVNRQSAIYISAYSSMDPGIRAPFIAHYKGINDFNLATHRKTWFAANSSQITGSLKIQTNDGDVDVQTAINNNKTYIHTAYCNTVDNSDNSFSKTYFTGAAYMGTAYTNSSSEASLTFNDYAPWVRLKGEDGQDGQDGQDGMGINSVEEWYYATSTSTTPTFNKNTWTQGSIPSNYNTTNKYLWNVEISVYTDGTKGDPTNPQMLGVYGKDGRGIQSITEYYKKSPNISGVLNTDSGWSTTVPTIDKTNRYLWNYELITFSDNTTSKTPAAMIGVFAEDGRSIDQVNEWYYVTSSDTPAPTFNENTWSYNSIPSMDATNSYLWNVEEIEYSDDTEYTSPALIGHFGTDGRGIQSITEYYKKSTNMEGETNTSLSGWSTTVPTMDQTNRYLWNFERINYDDGTHSDTAPALIGVYTVGEDGKYTQFVFKFSDTQPETPTGQTIPPSGWMTTVTGTGGSSQTITSPLGVTRTSGTYTSTSGKWKSPTGVSDSDKAISTFSFTLSTASKVIIRLEASSESNYDYGVAGLLDDTSRLANLDASTVKSNLSSTTYFKGAVSGTQTLDVEYDCTAGSHVIQIGYFKDQSQSSNNDCVYASFFTAQQQTSGSTLWMSFAVVDKGVVGTWSYPVPFIGKDGQDGADGRDGTNGTNGTNGKDAIAYYLSQSSGTVTYTESTFSPSTISISLVRSDRRTPIVDTIVKQGCNATYSSGTITVTPTSTTQGGYFEVTCLNDDGTTWGTLRYSYNLITKAFVSEIVEDQMTNYATKSEVNSLGQTVSSNSSWIQQNSDKVASAVTAQDLNGYVTESELTQTANTIKTQITNELSAQFEANSEDIIDLTSLNNNYWYPVSITLKPSTAETQRIMIERTLNTDYGYGQSYANHSRGFTLLVDWTTKWCGYGEIWNPTTHSSETIGGWYKGECNGFGYDDYRFINKYDYSYTKTVNSIPFDYIAGSIRQNYMTNEEIICLRGGSKYLVKTSYSDTTVTVHSSGYSSNYGTGRTMNIITYYTGLILPKVDTTKRSEIVQTIDSITASVDETNVRLDAGGFTINANTTVNGQLNINNSSEQGFIVVGDNGNTSILSKSIGTYSAFKNNATKWFIVNGSSNNAYYGGSSTLFTSSTINLGTIASGTTLTFRNYSGSAHKPNSGYPYTVSGLTGKIEIYRNGSVVQTFSNIYTSTGDKTYSVTTTDTYSLKLSWSFSSIKDGNNNNITGYVNTTFAMHAFIPSGTYTLIGYDGIASNFGNDKTVYFGAEGTYIRYTDNNILRVSESGIEKYCPGTTSGGSDYYLSNWTPINGCSVRKIGLSGTYSLRQNDEMIVFTITSGDVYFYLGSPSNNKGRKIFVKRVRQDSGGTYVRGYASGSSATSTIIPDDGGYGQTISQRELNWHMRMYVSDGTYWLETYQ